MIKNTEDYSDISKNILIGGKFEALKEAYNSYKPECYVEIGCFRLNTAINLLKTHTPKESYLLDLFEKAPSYEKPPEQSPLSIEEADMALTESLPNNKEIYLVKGNSHDVLPNVVNTINSKQFKKVMVFVDGGHSYITVIRDLINTVSIKHPMLIAIDDADWYEISVAISDIVKVIGHRNPNLKTLRPNLITIEID